MTFTFGPNGFFGYAPSSPTTTMWWSTCESLNPPSETRISIPEMQAQLRARHGNWKDPLIHSIISKADVEHIYPVWTTPALPFWGQGGVVLVGDAAHALQPTSGQGSSQAFEDAKTLSLCLAKYIPKDDGKGQIGQDGESLLPEALEKGFKLFYAVRSPRISKIVERTKILSGRKGDVGFVGEMMTCFFFWLMGKVPAIGKMLIGDVNKELYHWNVEEEIERVLKTEREREAAVGG
jgi:2-polyprenyl-6-methoxyphenol hydroxylase-like FAD-dependent oxidoreductase